MKAERQSVTGRELGKEGENKREGEKKQHDSVAEKAVERARKKGRTKGRKGWKKGCQKDRGCQGVRSTSSQGAVTPAMLSASLASGFEWERKESGWLCTFLTQGAPSSCPSIHLGYLTSSFLLWVPANTWHLSLAEAEHE